jgi:hypothetical protein
MKYLIALLLVILALLSLVICTISLKDTGLVDATSANVGQKITSATTPEKITTSMQPDATNQYLATIQQPATTQKATQVVVSAGSLTRPIGDFSAPVINGLNLKSGQQTGTAEYLDSQGRSVLLVEAFPLNDASEHTVRLKQLLDKIYGPSSLYVQSGEYPRFRYPQLEVQAGFFAVDANLTASQVLLLKEALDLFSRPTFATMQPDLFNSGIAYVLIDKIPGDTAGFTYAGTGVVELDRRDLFGNKYLLASVIAHEGSHVLQGPEASKASCAEQLKREVGDQTIPASFIQWDAAALLQAIKGGQIGAYHVSLWMLTRLRIKDTGWVAQAIKTGKVGGDSVVNCKL